MEGKCAGIQGERPLFHRDHDRYPLHASPDDGSVATAIIGVLPGLAIMRALLA